MLRPFLLVGVGGSGGKTLRVIREDLERRLHQAGWTGGFPMAWQFVQIDVPTTADGNDPDLPRQLPEKDYQGLVAAGVDYRNIDGALTGGGSKAAIADSLGGWRPDPNRVNIPASKGAGQYRALGRVITLAGLDRIRDALSSARRNLTGAEAVGQLQMVTRALGGEPRANVPEPTVVVISSIAGGSGSGAVIDVCDAIRAMGDKWANEIVGLLYAPDVFDYLPEEARRGVRPNSLAALSELLNGYWSSGPSEATTELFARYGVQVAAAQRGGPRFPFLVGARNEHVTYRTQNDIYRSMGRSLASWVTSATLQGTMNDYILAQWPATASAVPDRLPLKHLGTETPLCALGSSRVGLGRDRFRDYASEHLAQTVVERFLRRHEELRQRGDDRSERQLVRDTADATFGGFLASSGLDERGPDRNQIIDALRPESLADDLRAQYTEILRRTQESIPAKGARAADVRLTIRNEINDRRSQFQTAQLAARTERARAWVAAVQRNLTDTTARSVASHGAPVTVELLRRLTKELAEVRDELRGEAATHRRWAGDVDQAVSSSLADDGAMILQTTDLLNDAVKRGVQTFDQEQLAEIREMAVDLIPDLVDNLIEPLVQALEYGVESLHGDRNEVANWPHGGVIPNRLKPAPNEFLLEEVDDYPKILTELVQRTVSLAEPAEARRAADIQVLLGVDDSGSHRQTLIELATRWVPRNHLLHESVTAAPTRASFRIDVGAAHMRRRAEEWVERDGTTIGGYMQQGLRDYLDPEAAGPEEMARRLQRFQGQLIAALNAGAPLASVNRSVLQLVHERSEVAQSVSFSEVALPDRSPAKEVFVTTLQARDQWSEGINKAFTDSAAASIDIFTVMREPFQPVVFESLMRPIASEWGARSKAPDQRTEFWRWRRARPLRETLPFAPEVLRALVRGWFVAGCLDQLQVGDAGLKVFVPAEMGKGGHMADFPWPMLTQVDPKGPDGLPSVLESVSLALLEVAASESLAPMAPYSRLLALGERDGDAAPKELADWILTGQRANGDGDPATDWEVRRNKTEMRLQTIAEKFEEYFERTAERNELLGFPGSYELRHEILAGLGDLRRAVATLQRRDDSGVFF